LKSMDARDQRDRQQFHEAKVFDTVQAQAVTYWLVVQIRRLVPAA
jgi:hypothetical protein